jgi:hypothetical protein
MRKQNNNYTPTLRADYLLVYKGNNLTRRRMTISSYYTKDTSFDILKIDKALKEGKLARISKNKLTVVPWEKYICFLSSTNYPDYYIDHNVYESCQLFYFRLNQFWRVLCHLVGGRAKIAKNIAKGKSEKP